MKQDTIKMENKRCFNTIAEEDSTGFKKNKWKKSKLESLKTARFRDTKKREKN